MQKLSHFTYLLLCFTLGCSSTDLQEPRPFNKESSRHHPSVIKGNGISYGPYRDGESPDKNSLTSKEHITEDLRLIAKHWDMIRLYGSGELSERILQVIQEQKFPIKVMLGAWIDGHWSKEQNDAQVKSAIFLARQYREEICAVNIGNEIFVDWSYHRMEGEAKTEQVMAYIREVKNAIEQPVTVCDDYNFWNKPHSKAIADEIDFIGLHAYAFWNNITLAQALPWTNNIYESIQSIYPNHQIVMCESGWPTSRVYDDGSHEGGLIGKAGEPEQAHFFQAYTQWISENNITSLYFEAFDEQWKGGFDGKDAMNKCEKHWGLYYSNRQPKLVLTEQILDHE